MNQDQHSETENEWVLLAEGHPASRRLSTALLEKLGYRVTSVASGVEVLKKLEEDPQRFAILFMNCRLPELDGPETVKAVRWLEKQWGNRITIVALSADQHDREDCLAAGVDAVLVGPVTLQGLRQAIADLPSPTPANTGRKVTDADTPLLDSGSIAGLRRLDDGDSGDFLSEVIDIFLRDSAGLMERIRSAAQAGDRPAVRAAVHALKGSSGTVGASRLAKLCLELEQQIDRGTVGDLGERLQRLEAVYAETRQALIAEREG